MVLDPISTPMIGVALFARPNTGCLLVRSTVRLLPVEQGCHVPGDQVISRNSCDICAHGHSGTEGHRVLSFLLEEYYENDPRRRPDDEGQHQKHDRQPPAQERAEHESQGCITPAHATPREQDNQRKQTRTECRSPCSTRQTMPPCKGAKNQTNGSPGQDDRVGPETS